MLGYGYWELPPLLWDGAARLARAEELDGTVYLLELSAAPARSRGQAFVDLVIAPDPGGSLPILAGRARKMLRLDDDLTGFYRLCRTDARLRAVPRLGAGRLIRGTTLFEDTVKAIAWTNTTWTQAVRMIRAIGALGRVCDARPTLRAWPDPDTILAAGRPYLERTARLGYRAGYILDLARRVVEGRCDLDAIERMEDGAEQARALLGLRGVGPASAAYLQAMLGCYERPVLDSATLGSLSRAYFRGRRPTPAQVERRLARYGRWKGLVLWFGHWVASVQSRRVPR